jgi:DNA-binding MarR family transcriptional regulator
MTQPNKRLFLDNQLCFPFYAISRLITRAYQPLLEKFDLTYPRYLVLLVLWEHDDLTVNEIAERLLLNTNTLTPVLKALERQSLIKRSRSVTDERKVHVNLTDEGKRLRARASAIPEKLAEALPVPEEEAIELKEKLDSFLTALRKT